MVFERKRKYGSIKLNSTIQRVLKKFGENEVIEETNNLSKTTNTLNPGRKQRRREKKKQVKANKQAHFQFLSKKKLPNVITEEPTSRDLKLVKDSLPKKTFSQSKSKIAKIGTSDDIRKKSFKNDNAKEDKVISALEKKLFLNKRKDKKKLPKSFVDAGLDYILDVVNGGQLSEDSSSELEDEFFSKEDEDPMKESEDPLFTDNKEEDINNNDHEDTESSCDQEGIEESDQEIMDSDESIIEEVVETREKEEKNLSTATSKLSADSGKYIPPALRGKSEKSKKEDKNLPLATSKLSADSGKYIPPALRGTSEKSKKEGNLPTPKLSTDTGRYIPLALRVKLSIEQEENIRKLKRKVKGLFNRLSDANLNSICNDIEILYREGSRAVMHTVITEIIMDQFSAPDPVPDSLKMETAMLVSVLSAKVGIEVLMYFYEAAAVKLNSFLITKVQNDGKGANNLLQLLGCLYQLKSIDSKVMIDVFRILISSFTEKDIELILDILNKIGFQLRKDDPEALRDIIKEITSKCEALNDSVDDGSRMAYMLSVLMAVKNNNIRKVTGFDPDAIAARRKKLSSLTKNARSDGGTDTVPPVKLQDFLDADINGRWWIVGSSFAGRPMLDQIKKDNEEAIDIDFVVSKKVCDAAKTQRMNTDVRRKIFYAVMMADDFVDAFQKIIKCGLKGKQMREIPNVIVDCCQQEKSFNPYYLHLLNRFCQNDRQFGISLQCTLWDRFKVLNTLKQTQINNIAKLLTQLILIDALTLSCLKAIDFTEVDKTMVRFLRLIMCMLAEEASDIEKTRNIFEHLRASAKSKLVRQGLHLFLQYFMLSDEQFMTNHSSLRNHFQMMLSSVGKANQTFL